MVQLTRALGCCVPAGTAYLLQPMHNRQAPVSTLRLFSEFGRSGRSITESLSGLAIIALVYSRSETEVSYFGDFQTYADCYIFYWLPCSLRQRN